MKNHETKTIWIWGTDKRLYMNDMLNVIAHRKLSVQTDMENLIPYEDGEYISQLKNALGGGEIISFNEDGLWIAKFQYRVRKNTGDGYRTRWMHISYEEFLEFKKEIEVDERRGIETPLVSHYPKPNPTSKPYEVKVGDVLGWNGVDRILVTEANPHTFKYEYIFIDTMEVCEGYDGIATLEDYGNGPVWMSDGGLLISKIE